MKFGLRNDGIEIVFCFNPPIAVGTQYFAGFLQQSWKVLVNRIYDATTRWFQTVFLFIPVWKWCDLMNWRNFFWCLRATRKHGWLSVSCLGLGRPSVLLAVLQEWRCAVTLGRQVGNPVNELVEGRGPKIVELRETFRDPNGFFSPKHWRPGGAPHGA